MHQPRSLVTQLLERLEDIAQNTNYPEDFPNERCLVDPQTYLSLCKYVFPQLEIYIQEIQTVVGSPSDKLNYLLQLLSKALRIDMSKVDGAEIIRYNFSHIERLVVVLFEYSKILKKTSKRIGSVRSQDNSGVEFEHDKELPQSARGPAKSHSEEREERYQRRDREPNHRQEYPPQEQNYGPNYESDEQIGGEEEEEQIDREERQEDVKEEHVHFAENEEYLMPADEEQRVKRPQLKKKKNNRKTRNQKAERENLHASVVNTIMKEKTRMLEAGVRENRKNKMEDVEEAKDEYRNFLKRYTKDNKAKNNREAVLAQKSASAAKPLKKELPKEDFNKIDAFFQSFACRFRDKKANYLRKITALVRKQEIDRFCYHNRIDRETKKYMEDKLQKQLEGIRHQHRVKSELVRESAQNLEAEVAAMRRQQIKKATEQRRELKAAKKKELQQIENVLREDNDRVMMSLEEGGRLENIIMKMYKRF